MHTSRNIDIGLLILRLGLGFTMIYGHGWGKLMRFFSDDPIKFSDPFGLGPEISLALATFAELGCAALLAVGLFSRLATIPLIITMLVAVLYSHIDDPFSRMEKAILYLIPYVSLLLTGPGWYSLDEQWRKP